ncbi:S-layer homology domain-containing protein [Cronbergia sp. UHCC 0137]|uniref:S-layer homology domain-containing protein n=1 Tax=Cronbergia sp. UHCC 0137 TaxID=3110239 RepID=UPI002B20FAF6|nr:S-layer homology domain-containing protein [Cronbergia sp. UHCC 0137]MEA5618850.1 S-layer homology domain-containing protein [Cronbergia sp. UHCC 0137]
MRHLLSTISLLALLQILPTIDQAAAKENSPATESNAIQKVVNAKVMDNFPDGEFYPERLISRAELASILVKAFELENRQATKQEKIIVLPDVPSNYWAYQDIQTILKNDIMQGYRGGMFFPNQRITRAEALAIFGQAYGVFQFTDDTVNEMLKPYPDAGSIPSWARKAIATLVAEELIKTDSQNNINPLQPMTRGDMAHLLSEYLQRQGIRKPEKTK